MKKAMSMTAVLVAAIGVAQAGTSPGSWYVAPQIQGLWLDDARGADDDAGFAFSFGRVASPNWNFEIGAFTSEHALAGGDKLKLEGLDISALRVFYRDAKVHPYLLVGLGKIEGRGGPDDSESLLIKYGAGVLADIAKNVEAGTHLQLRGEVVGRRSDATSGGTLSDYLAGIGLQYSWGAPPPPPKRPIDSDGDGVVDGADKCPDTPRGTPVDADGCPLDSDGDGVVDGMDRCPNTARGVRVDASGCELDSDGDGVVDSRDQCPDTPAGIKVDARGCELDSDGDGVVDSKDECPDTPAGERVDFRGCPFTSEIQLPRVVFDTDSAELRPESFGVLDGAVETLRRYSDIRVEVAGHTDDVGSAAYNERLSQRRAETVLKYLQDKGVSNAIRARGYGERQPIASNATEQGRQTNRRVTLRIVTR